MLKKSLVANFLGKGWQALIQLLFIPFYAKLMGAEAYGLVGMFSLLVTLSCLFDTGLGSFLNRELSRFLALGASSSAFRNLVRTIEIAYLTICMAIGGAIIAFAPQIATSWLNVKALDIHTVEWAIALMGISFAVQLPAMMYQNALQGLQKQMVMNLFSSLFITIRAVGALLLLIFVTPSPVLFFVWQAASGAIHSISMRYLLWREMPRSQERTRFEKSHLLTGGKFAGGMTILTILGVLLANLDKIMLSRLLPLETFGYYSVAASLAAGLVVVVNPIFSSIFPLYSYVVALQDEQRLAELYHRTAQIMSVAIFPLMLLLSFFSREILLIWTGSEEVAQKAYLPLSFLAIGSGVSGLLHIPYALELAYGWLKLRLYEHALLVICMLLLLPFMIDSFGVAGAALVWAGANICMLLISSYFIHKKFLKKERFGFLVEDLFVPGAACLCVMLLGKYYFPSTSSRATMLVCLILLTGITFVVAFSVTRFPRKSLLSKFIKVRENQ